MDTQTRLNVELNFSAERLMQQVILRNDTIEKEIEAGLTSAFKELSSSDTFSEMIKRATIEAVEKTVNNAVSDWKLRTMIIEKLHAKIAEQVEVYTDGIAKELIEKLKKL